MSTGFGTRKALSSTILRNKSSVRSYMQIAPRVVANSIKKSINMTSAPLLRACSTITRRSILNTARSFSSYPAHEVVNMPALSPTMEMGSIIKWEVAVGDSFGPGTALCEIATDKATMALEATDDGVVAKLLAGQGEEI